MLESDFVWSLLNNLTQYWPWEIFRAGHPWDVVRNNAAIDHFLHYSKADVFVKMDVDQVYPPNYFLDMVVLVESYGMIGPVIYDRHERNEFKTLAFANKVSASSWLDVSDGVGIKSYPYTHTNNFYHRRVLERIPPPWYEAELREDGLERANHVDYDFLDKVKEYNPGQECWINHDVVVEHIADVKGNREFYRKHKGDSGG